MIIYKATNLINGKFYIGQTVNLLRKRISQHKYNAFVKKTKKPFYYAIRKYGWNNFKWKILDDKIDNINILNEKEVYWIKILNTLLPNGYNLTGGGKGYIISEPFYALI